MKLSSLLGSRPNPAYGKTLHHFFSTTQTLNGLVPESLYKRIAPIGDPSISVVPVLDQWVREGRDIRKRELQNIIRELKTYKRFKHALEVFLLTLLILLNDFYIIIHLVQFCFRLWLYINFVLIFSSCPKLVVHN